MQSNSPKALVEQLQVLLSSSDSANIPKDTKLQACQLARKLWLELEEPGDLIDRMVYRVCMATRRSRFQSLNRYSLKRMLCLK